MQSVESCELLTYHFLELLVSQGILLLKFVLFYWEWRLQLFHLVHCLPNLGKANVEMELLFFKITSLLIVELHLWEGREGLSWDRFRGYSKTIGQNSRNGKYGGLIKIFFTGATCTFNPFSTYQHKCGCLRCFEQMKRTTPSSYNITVAITKCTRLGKTYFSNHPDTTSLQWLHCMPFVDSLQDLVLVLTSSHSRSG